MPGQLPHTERVQQLLREGKIEEAKRLQNAHVKSELDRAKAGETINLSDLMAGKEEIVYKESTNE